MESGGSDYGGHGSANLDSSFPDLYDGESDIYGTEVI